MNVRRKQEGEQHRHDNGQNVPGGEAGVEPPDLVARFLAATTEETASRWSERTTALGLAGW